MQKNHVARAQDFRGIEYGKTLNFANSNKGFCEFFTWFTKLCAEHPKDNIIVSMEPIGHYWFCLAKFLIQKGIKIAIVNPMHVKKSKELDDNSPTKNDPKDARVIAQLVKDGRFPEPNMPQRAVCIKRAQLLVEKVKISICVTEGIVMAEYELHYLLDKYDTAMLKLDVLMAKVEVILSEIPGAKEMMLIPGLGLVTVAGFLSEVCEMVQYAHSRQIQKLAGLTLKEYSSGKHKGQTTITKISI